LHLLKKETCREMKKMDIEALKNVDIINVSKETLVDIKDVKIDKSLNLEERKKSFIRQIKNPYCYICNGFIIKSKFAVSGNTFSESFNDFINANI